MANLIKDETTDYGSPSDPSTFPKALHEAHPEIPDNEKMRHTDANIILRGILDVVDWFRGSKTDVMTDLLNVTGKADGAPAHIKGRLSVGDNGGAQYRWSSSSTATHDGTNVVKPTAVSGAGRWLLEYTDYPIPPGSVKTDKGHWYLIGSDLGAAINKADTALGSAQGQIFVADGDWGVSTKIVLSSNRVLSFGKGTISSHVLDDMMISLGGTMGSFSSNIVIEGKGWSTILRENDNITNLFSFGYVVISVDSRGDTGGQSGYGNYTFRDFQILGRDTNTIDGTLYTIGIWNARDVKFERLYLNSTSCIGIVIGGSADATGGQYANRVWVTDCLFENVAQQPVAPINSANVHISGNTFKGGPRFGNGTFVDFETNTSADHVEDFTIDNNLFDCRGGMLTGEAVFGIGILGNNPTTDDAWIGPGQITNNVFMGRQYPPETATDTVQLSSPITLFYARDITVQGNTFRGAAPIIVNGCDRCSIVENKLIDLGGPAVVTIENSRFTAVKGNEIVFSTLFGGASPVINEIGTSNFTQVCFNYATPPDASTLYPLADPLLITLVGDHSRQYCNYIGGWRGGLEGDSFGELTVDGTGFRLLGAVAGNELYHTGFGYRPADRRTSDNLVSLFQPDPTVATSFNTFSGSSQEVGTEIFSSVEGYITEVRFFKHASDTSSTHTWHIWADAAASIATGTFGTETASGWQRKTLSAPIHIQANRKYYLTYTVNASTGAGRIVNGFSSNYNSYPLYVNSGRGLLGTAGSIPGSFTNDNYLVDWSFQVGKMKANNVSEYKITGTGATDVLTLTNPASGNYQVLAYYRVITATTTVTITVTWTDATGAQSNIVVNAVSSIVGSYSVAPILINVAPNSTDIKVTATAGTGNQVFVSAAAVLL